MSISGDYPTPVQVNGFTCKNCTDVDYAKKHIDPAHPKSGPYGIDAASDPTNKDAAKDAANKPSVTFGGSLTGLNGAAAQSGLPQPANSVGSQLDLTA